MARFGRVFADGWTAARVAAFDNAEMLFMSEVEHILTETLQSRKEETNNAYEFGPVVEKAYNYAKRFSTFTNTTHPQHIRQ